MITVLLATRDRAESLGRMLHSLLALREPPGGWKLVVADNGSRDSTEQVLARFKPQLPLSVVFEPVAGKNRALNRALALLEGEMVVFTDDDVIPDADWLVRLHEAAVAQRDASIFGGTVVPLWPGRRPAFVSEKAVDFGLLFARKERPTGWCKPEEIYGPNMAVRANVFAGSWAFSEEVGPNGSRRSYTMGGEFELLRRLSQAGCRAWFTAEARVQHIVRPEQLTEAWILERYFRYGLFMQRNGWGQGRAGLRKHAIWSACAALARLMPQSSLRLRILSRHTLFQGIFAADPPLPESQAGMAPLAKGGAAG
jgi:glucosyl-dolichyl phosphate glucuronosyltransferase